MSLKDIIKDTMPLLIGVSMLVGSSILGVRGIKEYDKIYQSYHPEAEVTKIEREYTSEDIKNLRLAGGKMGLGMLGFMAGFICCTGISKDENYGFSG